MSRVLVGRSHCIHAKSSDRVLFVAMSVQSVLGNGTILYCRVYTPIFGVIRGTVLFIVGTSRNSDTS
eukprot:COSAG02_NODE_1660_length_11449_cov_6.953128_3_plen_67_part_00